MRVVADTNIVVSSLLWPGPPRLVLDAARAGSLSLFTSAVLLAELEDVLVRPKFVTRLKAANVTAQELVLGYGALATIVNPALLDPIILADPDDDAVLACAVAAMADVIVSGDQHLLELGQYKDMAILTASLFLSNLAPSGPVKGP
jgi:putative PIN family toxin of toxin-antitoxin system